MSLPRIEDWELEGSGFYARVSLYPDEMDATDKALLKQLEQLLRVLERVRVRLGAADDTPGADSGGLGEERDRLRAILAAEQGREGLPGWQFEADGEEWWARDDGDYVCTVVANGLGEPWTWSVERWLGDLIVPLLPPREGTAPTALEAMESASSVLAEVSDG